MGKRGAFAVITLLLLISILFSLVVFAQSEDTKVDVDPFVESALTVAPEVKVIIVLKEPDIDTSKNANSNEILEETKDAVEDVKAEFLENMSEPVNDFGVASDESPINVTQTYETINVIAATVTQEGLEELKDNPAVEQVILEPIFHVTMIDTVPLINANDVHNLSIAGTNLNGTGMIACVLDSGIELNHSAFTGRILQGYDFINSDNSSDDDMSNSHGTHVSGSIAALTPNGTGIAPASKLIPIKVCNATGSCSASAILSGIDYCNNLTSTYNISVLSMSISDGGQYTSGTCPTFFDSGLNTSVALGLIPVMASGNDGFTGGISYPACSPNTISVGSTTKADAMSSFTNRGGDTLDILAPGSSIISTIRGNTVGVLSGTSMATPHVSGLVLLMQQNEQLNGRPALNISSIRSILKETGVPVSSWIRIDAYNAITKLNQNYTINNSARSVSYQVGSETSRVTFDNSTDFSNFAQCSVLGASFVSINSSACPQFNKSASIRLGGIVAANVSPTKDGVLCGSNCTNVNFSGGILTFNVSSFSNYSYEVSNSSNSSGSNSSIMNVTSHYNLTGDFNGSIHLLANDIILDCQGFTISASADAAVRADSRTNITIKNCNLTGTTDILFNGTSGSSVQNIEGNGSVVFINGDNNVIESAQISSNGTWISADASSTGNIFANLTIENSYGSIEWLDNLSVPSSTTANQTNLRIQEGQVSLNSSQLGWMNETAQVTLLNLSGALSSAFSPSAALSQIPIIDENDDGTFTVCPESVCNQTEYSSNSLTFITQHFTTINSTTSFPVSINDSSTLVQNISVNGSAVTFNNNSITLDCLNNRMTGNTSGIGITATNRNNITIKNCALTSFSNAISVTSSNNTIIQNNIVSNSTGAGITTVFSSSTSFNLSVLNNTINQSSANLGIRIQGTFSNVTVSNNTVNNSVGSGIQVNSNNSLIENNLIISNTTAIDITTQNTIIRANRATSTSGQGFISTGTTPQSTNNTLLNNNLSSVNNYAIFLGIGAIQTTGTNNSLSGSKGIGISGSTTVNNTFNNTIITINSTGLEFGITNNATFFNTTIESNSSWITFTSPANFSNVNLAQTTFTTANGSIYTPGNFSFPNGSSLNKTSLDIFLNEAFINSSIAPYLNQSAQITLVNSSIKFLPGGLSADFEDDGTFVNCPSNVCSFISQNSTNLVFNVSHFTSYSSNSSFPAIVNESSNLTTNVTANTTAFIINASNTTFDCLGFTIFYNGNGSDNESAISATFLQNITVQNCILVDTNSSGQNTLGINFTNITTGFILNNTVGSNGTSSAIPVKVENSTFVTVRNSMLTSLGSAGGNIALQFANSRNSSVVLSNLSATDTSNNDGISISSSSFINVTNSTVFTSGTNNNNIPINIASSNDNIIEYNNLTSNGSAAGNRAVQFTVASRNNISFNRIVTVGTTDSHGIDVSVVSNNNTIVGNNIDVVATSGSHGLYVRVGGANGNNVFINNTVNVTASTSHGIFVESGTLANTFINNNVSSIGTSSYGVRLDTSGNNLTNTTIRNSSGWISSSATNNLTNTTFDTSSGNINYISNLTLVGAQDVTRARLNISSNRAFVNSSALSLFNNSARITLTSVNSSVPYVDFNDDNIFDVCNPPQCVVESFSGSTAIFNVSSFTSYSTSSSGNVSVTLSKGDSTNSVSPGDIFTYQINYTVTNGTSFNTTIQENYPSQIIFVNSSPAANVSNNVWLAQNLTEGSTFQINVTVQVNNSVLSSTTANNTVNVSFANSTGSAFSVNVSETTSIVVVFPVTIATNTTLSGNVTTNGSAFVFNTSGVTFNCNGSSVIDSSSGVAFNVTNASNVSIINCRVEGFTSDVLLFNSTFANVTNTTLVTPTTWLSADSTSNATLINVTFQNGLGSMASLAQINVPNSSNINNAKVNISQGRAFANVTNLTFLNTSFRIRLDNLNLANLSVIADLNDDNIFQLCADCSLVSFNGTTAIFDVTHFTTYSAIEGGVNFSITKTASPDPATPGSQVTYTITFTVNSGFANNVTITENPPVELTFVSSTPANTSANTWSLGNLSAGQSSQINVTYNISSNFTGTLNNTINSTFQNNTNNTIVSNTTTTSTVSTGGAGTSSGGGGGGGSNSVICPPLCSDPLNKDLAICKNNCPQPTQQIAAPVAFPEFPIAKESSSSEQVDEKESAEAKESVEQAPPIIEETKSENENNKNSIVSSAAFKFGLPLVLGIALLIFILSRIPRHPNDKFSSELRKNEDRIKELERKLKS